MRNRWHVAAWMMAVAAAAVLGGCGVPREEEEPLSSPTYERALAMLQEQAHSADPKVRANCIEALQAGRDPRGEEVIEEGLHDKDAGVRFVAAMAAGQRRVPSQAVRSRLNTLVTTDPDENVRVGCAFALRRLGDASHWNDLGAAMESRNWEVRANAALAVGMSGDREDRVLLEHYRNDPDVRVRFEITAALARLGNPEAQKVVVSECVSKFAEDQYHAMEVCAYLPQDVGVSPLLQGLTDTPPTLPPNTDAAQVKYLTTRRQLIAARSLAKLKYNNKRAAEVAIANAADPDPQLRALALLALGDMLTSREAPKLERFLADEDEGVRLAAAAAVVNIYGRAGKK
jgi:HEAT repeat protein